MTSIFAPKSSRIIRIILENPKKKWTIREMSKEANISLGFVHKILIDLEKLGYVYRESKTNKLVSSKHDELLDRWAYASDFRNNQFFHYYLHKSIYDSAKQLFSKIKFDYAATGPFACDILTQHLRSATIHIYVKSEDAIKKWVKKCNLEVAERGGNIVFVIPFDEGVFYKSRIIKDKRIGVPFKTVGNIQLYIDLFNYPARGREGAEHLRQFYIKFPK